MRELFIAATDTGVGKTSIGCAILRHARSRGLTVAASKPLESGFDTDEHDQSDVGRLSRAAGKDCASTYRFTKPLAPGVAAQQQGTSISPGRIVEDITALRGTVDLLVVEGAGGLFVPVTSNLLIIDLIRMLAMPVLLVCRAGLGTINHTLLSIEALRARDIEIAHIVLNATDDFDPTFAKSNAAEIAHHGRVALPSIVEPALNEDLDISPLQQLAIFQCRSD